MVKKLIWILGILFAVLIATIVLVYLLIEIIVELILGKLNVPRPEPVNPVPPTKVAMKMALPLKGTRL